MLLWCQDLLQQSYPSMSHQSICARWCSHAFSFATLCFAAISIAIHLNRQTQHYILTMPSMVYGFCSVVHPDNSDARNHRSPDARKVSSTKYFTFSIRRFICSFSKIRYNFYDFLFIMFFIWRSLPCPHIKNTCEFIFIKFIIDKSKDEGKRQLDADWCKS